MVGIAANRPCSPPTHPPPPPRLLSGSTMLATIKGKRSNPIARGSRLLGELGHTVQSHLDCRRQRQSCLLGNKRGKDLGSILAFVSHLFGESFVFSGCRQPIFGLLRIANLTMSDESGQNCSLSKVEGGGRGWVGAVRDAKRPTNLAINPA